LTLTARLPAAAQDQSPQIAPSLIATGLDSVLRGGLRLILEVGMETGRMENRQLFALGGVYPRGWPDRPTEMLAECLIEGPPPEVAIEVRFEQPVERQILGPGDEPVEQLLVTGRRYVSGEETIGRDVRLSSLPNRTAAIETAGSERMELIEAGAPAGTVLWRREPLHATVEAWTEEVRPGLHRVRVAVANRLEWEQDDPERNGMCVLRSAQVHVESPAAAFAARVGRLRRLREAPAARFAAA
jgi:hypothetical protein